MIVKGGDSRTVGMGLFEDSVEEEQNHGQKDS